MKSIKDFRLKSENSNFIINSLGYGQDHDEKILQGISSTFDGSFYYIENNAMVDECFLDCIGNLMAIIAENVKINVMIDKNLKIGEKFGKFWKKEESQNLGVI